MAPIIFLGRRFLQTIPTLAILLAAIFGLVRLTGDPARLYLGDFATPEALEEVRTEWGLNDPLPVQFADYALGVFRGDLGISLRYARPVSALIAERLSASLRLATAALALAVLIAIPLGTLAALRQGLPSDVGIRMLSVIGQAVPRFYLGILFILLFGLYLKWLPTSGSSSWRHLLLPAITLSTPTIALLTRLTRSAVLDIVNQDYVRTAKSKGLPPWRINLKHVLRNALITPLTVITIQFSQLMGGAVVVETIFGWPGLGQLAIQSVYTRDFVLIQGIVLVFAAIVLTVNILTDALYGLVDPRIRYG